VARLCAGDTDVGLRVCGLGFKAAKETGLSSFGAHLCAGDTNVGFRAWVSFAKETQDSFAKETHLSSSVAHLCAGDTNVGLRVWV